MFWSTDHHQVISRKLRTRCNAVKIIFLKYGIPQNIHTLFQII